MLARDAAGVHDVCRRCYVYTGERIERSTTYKVDVLPG